MSTDAAPQSQWAFDAYEAVRARLPQTSFPTQYKQVAHLADLAQAHDVFLLDAFGVLNIGNSAIPGAPDRIAALQTAGKSVIVVSNAASVPKRVLLEKYARLGFHFAPDKLLSSRAVMLRGLEGLDTGHIGMMGLEEYGDEELEALDFTFLTDDPRAYEAADSFVLLASPHWNEVRQNLLTAALKSRPRPVYVGNPDIVAPIETGLSKQPGHFAHLLADATGVVPQFFGKPFGNIFEMARELIPVGTDDSRVVMVGDTLQTDILGGQTAGFSTALITNHGALKGLDVAAAVQKSGIVPHFVMPTT